MTSSMTSQSDLKVVSLYSFMNDKITFFMITEERTNKDIIFKLSVHMYHWNVNMRLQAILEYFVDDVIRSQNKSKLWTTIALSKFELEKRSTAQNVANWTGYQKFKFQFHIQISKVWQVSNLRLPFHLLWLCHQHPVVHMSHYSYFTASMAAKRIWQRKHSTIRIDQNVLITLNAQ